MKWAKNPNPPEPTSPSVTPTLVVTPVVINPFITKVPDTGYDVSGEPGKTRNAGNNKSGKGGAKENGPDTGDENRIYTWLLLFVISAGVLMLALRPGLAAYFRRRRNNDKETPLMIT